MRRTLTTFSTGLAGAAAFVLLTACGGGSDSSAASSSTASSSTAGTTSSSAAESSSGGDAGSSEFCQQAAQLQNELQSAPDISNPEAAVPAIQQLADAVRRLDPPQEIASDWTKVADAMEQLAQILGTTDVNDPQQAAAAQQELADLQTNLTPAITNVGNYLSSECGLTTGAVDPTPTS
jgi:hypothetical protein